MSNDHEFCVMAYVLLIPRQSNIVKLCWGWPGPPNPNIGGEGGGGGAFPSHVDLVSIQPKRCMYGRCLLWTH